MARAARSSRGAETQERAVTLMPGQPLSWQHNQHLNFRWELHLKGNEACILGFDCAVALSDLDNGGARERGSIRADPNRADVYTVTQSDLRMSIWSEARCGLAVGNKVEIFAAWKPVAGCQPHGWQHRARVSQWTGTTTRT